MAVGCGRRLNGRVSPVEFLVRLFLPPFCRHVLVEVALRVHEPDANQRHAEVARLLAMVARQDTEPACVNGQGLMQRELRREVGDRLRADIGKRPRPPRVGRAPRRVEISEGFVVEREKLGIAGRPLQRRLRNHAQHAHRIVRGGTPQRVVEAPKNLTCAIVPAPPEVQCELRKTSDAVRERG